MFNTLKVNRTVDISINGFNSNIIRCKVKEIAGDRLTVLLPVDVKKPDGLMPGNKVKITYIDTTAVYTFLSQVINVGALSVTLGKPLDLTRIQRRNYVRIDIKLQVTVTRLNNSESNEEAPKPESFTATTLDISGGGLLLTCNEDLALAEKVELQVSLGQNQTVNAIGRVMRIVENTNASKYKFSVGVEFLSIKETERDKIIRFIFNRQRELRTKGLL